MTSPHVAPHFDELIHAPIRLRICAALALASEVEFSGLEDVLGVSTSVLSKQLKLLADAGYVRLDKRQQPVGRPRTWVRFTAAGRVAYSEHVVALQSIVAGGGA